MTANRNRQPTLFIPHGGGPCFFMNPPPGPPGTWDGMAAYLRGIPATLEARPKAILVISAHWEAPRPTVMTAERPPMLFDYYGFPEETYRLRYPAPGDPALAARVRSLLSDAGIASDVDGARGFDHGVFVPFLLIDPEASIPVLQLSLVDGLDSDTHLAIGGALAPLRDEGVLIVGSGMSYHNLRAMLPVLRGGAPVARDPAARFDAWLVETVEHASPVERAKRLENWLDAPDARDCHPREEHLLPLMVAAGAAGDDPGRHVYGERVMGGMVSGFRFG